MRNGETLRSFAQMVDKRLKSDEMSKLTRYYEQIIYSDQTGSFNENVAFNEWKTLLVKLTKTNLTR